MKILLYLTALLIISGGNSMAYDGLDAKQNAIVEVSAYAALGNQQGLKQALIKSLDAGTTVNELKEVLTQSYAYCGFPRSLNALGTLMQTINERGDRDLIGKDISDIPHGDALIAGTENQTKLVGTPVTGELFEFAPAIDQYLKAHLFGDIFSRDILDWKTRELATVAMLAVRDGVESQLKAHVAIAKHNGWRDEQIEAVLKTAAEIKAKNVIFGFGTENPYAQYFTGKSYLQKITTENGVPMFNVTFEPKCRNNWHIHHKGGQILLVTQGRGWYQAWGEQPRELKAGDVVNIPAETKHWHGAAKDSWFTHIAVEVPSDGGSTEWLEIVDDDAYNQLP